jgi:hypothetical protein
VYKRESNVSAEINLHITLILISRLNICMEMIFYCFSHKLQYDFFRYTVYHLFCKQSAGDTIGILCLQHNIKFHSFTYHIFFYCVLLWQTEQTKTDVPQKKAELELSVIL